MVDLDDPHRKSMQWRRSLQRKQIQHGLKVTVTVSPYTEEEEEEEELKLALQI